MRVMHSSLLVRIEVVLDESERYRTFVSRNREVEVREVRLSLSPNADRAPTVLFKGRGLDVKANGQVGMRVYNSLLHDVPPAIEAELMRQATLVLRTGVVTDLSG